jgi:hypothetical protein
MPFEARLFIQGTGVFVPHEDGDSVLVLFPSWEKADQSGLNSPAGSAKELETAQDSPRGSTKAPAGRRSRSDQGAGLEMPERAPVKPHHAVVQFDARNLAPTAPNAWLTRFCAGQWVTVETDPQPRLQLGQESILQGIPDLGDVAKSGNLGPSADQLVRSEVLPGKDFDPEYLTAGLYLESGALSPSGDHLGAWQLTPGKAQEGEERYYSSVIKVEFGEVDRFALRFRPFEAAAAETLDLFPIGDELDVWVRHFCDIEQRPVSRYCEVEAEEPDEDFALNYALAKDFAGLAKGRLPVPQVWGSWSKGSPIGGDPCRCMGCKTSNMAYSHP